MTGRVETKLKDLGITLPQPAPAVANYVPFVITGNLVMVSGQLPMEAGKIVVAGRLGETLGVEDGYKAARLCAINLLAQAKAAAGGNLDKVRLLRLAGFVASAPDFTDQPKVLNGASDLMAEALGEQGRHARVAVGVPVLPLNAAVEVEGIFELL